MVECTLTGELWFSGTSKRTGSMGMVYDGLKGPVVAAVAGKRQSHR
ncbi:hypothetical protein SAMN04489842_3205 [Natronobacterium texcoconense]|uniref:Uncharacterized protein n=1 Tax=Natronobacterium texcoconense TaxID=1095778 RepID=A0A1H1I1F6_NATTX|nr:hypothetical protein SAMN04489842_3205 [Natronobacterium texcoconense]